MKQLITQNDELKEVQFDFVLTTGLLLTSSFSAIEENNKVFGTSIPEINSSSNVAVKFQKLKDDCIATIAIEGEGVYQIIVNKAAHLEQAQMFDENTFLRFQDIIEAALQMAKSGFKDSTQNTKMNF